MTQSLLIVKLSSLGDVIHTLPAAQALRRTLGEGARLGWAVERAHAGIVRSQPWLDEVVEWDRRNGRTFLDFVRRLRAGRWDVAVDFQGLFRSGLVTWLSGASRRVGFGPSREFAHWFYNDRVPRGTLDRHAIERSLDLAARLGATFSGVPIERPYLEGRPPDAEAAWGKRLFPLHPSPADRAAVEAFFQEHGFVQGSDRLVVLNPHCRRQANRWPAARFALLARRLLAVPGVRIALAGGEAAREVCDEIAAPLEGAAWRADGRFSVLGTAELLARAAVVVTGDTGPMHLAAAVGAPVVALFGATSPRRTGPYTADAVIVREQLDCSPCLAKRCLLGHEPALCMQRIDVERVFLAVRARLDIAGPGEARKSA